jgi:hypothetical protein
MERDETFYLEMLGHLLLEIRHMEPDELPYAPKLAYIFHNIPYLLLSSPDEHHLHEAYTVMRERASALGLTRWLDACEEYVEESLARRRAST